MTRPRAFLIAGALLCVVAWRVLRHPLALVLLALIVWWVMAS